MKNQIILVTLILLVSVFTSCNKDKPVYASFTMDKHIFYQWDIVQFKSTSTGKPVHCKWTIEGPQNFEGSGGNVSFQLKKKGTYSVTLTAYNDTYTNEVSEDFKIIEDYKLIISPDYSTGYHYTYPGMIIIKMKDHGNYVSDMPIASYGLTPADADENLSNPSFSSIDVYKSNDYPDEVGWLIPEGISPGEYKIVYKKMNATPLQYGYSQSFFID